MTHIESRNFYVFSYISNIMRDYSKKIRGMLFLSKSKKIVILIVTGCLVLAGLSPTINSIFAKNNNETFTDDYYKINEGIKETGYDNNVIAFASFHWTPSYPDPGEKVTFYSNSYAYNGFITSERWDFHDEYTGHDNRPIRTYEKKGSYRVTLHVTAFGFYGGLDWDSSTRYVKVGADPFPKITCTPKNPSPGEQVTLDASNSNDPDGKIISYKWSYYKREDPENVIELGSDETISYTWEKQGIYIVSLFIEDDKGNNNTIEETIRVSILKLGGFPTRSRGLSFKITNHGKITANNLNWNVRIDKYGLIGSRSKPLYQKSKTIPTLGPSKSQKIEVKDIRRAFCKIKLVVTAKADNAVEVSKSFYGVVFLKRIYLSEENFANPYTCIVGFGLLLVFILLIISSFR
jgi:hypothetical protein